jgi:hypothetical protein
MTQPAHFSRFLPLFSRIMRSGHRESNGIQTMNYRVTYEHSLQNAPDEFIVQVPVQVVSDVPENVRREELADFITKLILERSPGMGKIRNMRVL